jgi:dTDP-4-dehydrorhamnose 3,5-epimerase
MMFSKTAIEGVYIVDVERHEDGRGYFARTYCGEEFRANGLERMTAQSNLSFNARRGTLRGLHFRYPPASETKYVRCTRGSIFDVAVDLRPESATYLDHVAVHLSAENARGLYIPERFAHGFITLEDNTELTYLMAASYTPGADGGLRYDDPGLGIKWPLPVDVILTRDLAWETLGEIEADLKARMSVHEAVA